MRHLWQEASGAFANVVAVPAGSHLWYDDRHISFLQEDERDAADIFAADMSAVRQGIEAGFEPDAVLEAAAARDLLRMTGRHTGLTSVQLQPAAEDEPAADEPPAALEEGVE
jgi:hypothetical protein